MPTGIYKRVTTNWQQRFWSKVKKTDGCWFWLAAKTKGGYGLIQVDGSLAYAHRLSYEIAHGRIPDGLQIDHLCRTRSCVCPSHLEAVAPAENTRRGIVGETIGLRPLALLAIRTKAII